MFSAPLCGELVSEDVMDLS